MEMVGELKPIGPSFLSDDDLEKIKRRALQISAALETKRGPYHSELVAEVSPAWHAITTAPGDEGKALNFLADRGFGVYLPQFDIIEVRHGRKHTIRRNMFPRHLFLFVWDVLRHWRRIKACPGVNSILTVDEKPVIVSDHDINRMQFLEFNPDAGSKKRKRRKRRNQYNLDDYDLKAGDLVTISCKSYWSDLKTLDDEARIGVLHRALGLAS